MSGANTLVGGGHHVGCVERLDKCIDGQIGAERWWSEEHHGLGCRELLPLGHQGARSLDASAKYGTVVTSWSPPIVGGDEEDAGAGSSDEGRGGATGATPAA
jgi:hypothetical protein